MQQVTANSGRDEVPILLYHRFGPAMADGMTVTTKVFASHLEYLTKNGYTIIPLRKLIDFYLRKVPDLPPKSVVIVADDGPRAGIRVSAGADSPSRSCAEEPRTDRSAAIPS